MLYAKPTKSEILHNDLSVITNILATFNFRSRPSAKEQSFVPVQRLYVNCDNWECELQYNIFQNLVRVIPIDVSDINFP
jgi:hypothetical protein